MDREAVAYNDFKQFLLQHRFVEPPDDPTAGHAWPPMTSQELIDSGNNPASSKQNLTLLAAECWDQLRLLRQKQGKETDRKR